MPSDAFKQRIRQKYSPDRVSRADESVALSSAAGDVMRELRRLGLEASREDSRSTNSVYIKFGGDGPGDEVRPVLGEIRISDHERHHPPQGDWPRFNLLPKRETKRSLVQRVREFIAKVMPKRESLEERYAGAKMERGVWYHGTSVRHLRSILSQGLIPDPKERAWGSDPHVSAVQISRVSYGGIYVTRNLMTARASIPVPERQKDTGVIVVMELQARALTADEDDFANRLYRHATESDEQLVISYIRWKLGLDDLKGQADTYVDVMVAQFEYEQGKKPFPPQMKRVLEPLFRRAFYAALTRRVAYYNTDWLSWNYQYVRAVDRAEETPPIAAQPDKQKAEAEFRAVVDQLTRTWRGIHRHKNSTFVTARSLEPIRYSGRNRIIAVVQLVPVTPPGETSSTEGVKVVYGKLPEDFKRQWQERVGSLILVESERQDVRLIEALPSSFVPSRIPSALAKRMATCDLTAAFGMSGSPDKILPLYYTILYAFEQALPVEYRRSGNGIPLLRWLLRRDAGALAFKLFEQGHNTRDGLVKEFVREAMAKYREAILRSLERFTSESEELLEVAGQAYLKKNYLDGQYRVYDLGTSGWFHLLHVTPNTGSTDDPDARKVMPPSQQLPGSVTTLQSMLRRDAREASARLERLGFRRQRLTLIMRDLSKDVNSITGGGVGGWARREAHVIEAGEQVVNLGGGITTIIHEWAHMYWYQLPKAGRETVRRYFARAVVTPAKDTVNQVRVGGVARQQLLETLWEEFDRNFADSVFNMRVSDLATWLELMDANPEDLGSLRGKAAERAAMSLAAARNWPLWGTVRKSFEWNASRLLTVEVGTVVIANREFDGRYHWTFERPDPKTDQVAHGKESLNDLVKWFKYDEKLTLEHTGDKKLKDRSKFVRLVAPKAEYRDYQLSAWSFNLRVVLEKQSDLLGAMGVLPMYRERVATTFADKWLDVFKGRVTAEKLKSHFMLVMDGVLPKYERPADIPDREMEYHLSNKTGAWMRRLLAIKGVTTSDYGASSAVELWPELVVAATKKDQIAKDLQALLKNVLSGRYDESRSVLAESCDSVSLLEAAGQQYIRKQFLQGQHVVVDWGNIGWFRVYLVLSASATVEGQKDILPASAVAGGEHGFTARVISTLEKAVKTAQARLERGGFPRRRVTLLVRDMNSAAAAGGTVMGVARYRDHVIECNQVALQEGAESATRIIVHEWAHWFWLQLPMSAKKSIRKYFKKYVLIPLASDMGAGSPLGDKYRTVVTEPLLKELAKRIIRAFSAEVGFSLDSLLTPFSQLPPSSRTLAWALEHFPQWVTRVLWQEGRTVQGRGFNLPGLKEESQNILTFLSKTDARPTVKWETDFGIRPTVRGTFLVREMEDHFEPYLTPDVGTRFVLPYSDHVQLKRVLSNSTIYAAAVAAGMKKDFESWFDPGMETEIGQAWWDGMPYTSVEEAQNRLQAILRQHVASRVTLDNPLDTAALSAHLMSPLGEWVRQAAKRARMVPSAYAAFSDGELWAELVEHSVRAADSLNNGLKQLLKNIMQGVDEAAPLTTATSVMLSLDSVSKLFLLDTKTSKLYTGVYRKEAGGHEDLFFEKAGEDVGFDPDAYRRFIRGYWLPSKGLLAAYGYSPDGSLKIRRPSDSHLRTIQRKLSVEPDEVVFIESVRG